MVYLDLDEMERVFKGRWFWSIERPNLAWFRRRDYLFESDEPLREAVVRCVTESGGPRPEGPIRILTHLRYFGYCFNPVTFYYCFEPDGVTLASLIVEITNTPWLERRRIVLMPESGDPALKIHRFRFAKDFHVSPFFPLDLDYDWRFSIPGERLNVHMRLDRDQEKQFDASLRLTATPINTRSLTVFLIGYPLMTLKVLAGIYLEALRLKWKGVPVHDHPGTPPPNLSP